KSPGLLMAGRSGSFQSACPTLEHPAVADLLRPHRWGQIYGPRAPPEGPARAARSRPTASPRAGARLRVARRLARDVRTPAAATGCHSLGVTGPPRRQAEILVGHGLVTEVERTLSSAASAARGHPF